MAWMDKVREIPDFPEPGVLFRDVLPLMLDPESWNEALTELSAAVRRLLPDVVMGPEARGFLLAAPVADRLQKALLPVRKPGKLPKPVFEERYTLEYGENRLEVEAYVRLDGKRVVIVDDVLATGGTVQASARLAQRLGGEVVGYAFLIELSDLRGRARLGPESAPVVALASR